MDKLTFFCDVGHAVLLVALLCFIVAFKCKGKKLSGFAWVQISLLMMLDLIAISRELVMKYADSFTKMINSIITILFLLISLNFAIRYFYTSNIIYQFSKNGLLPTEKSKFRFKVQLVLFNLLIFLFGMGFLALTSIFVLKKDLEIAMIIYKFGLFLYAIGGVVTIVFLSLAMMRLIRSKAKASD